MHKNIQDLLNALIQNALKSLQLEGNYQRDFYLDFPSNSCFGDLTTNIALQLSKAIKKNPYEVAESIVTPLKTYLEKTIIKNYVKEIKIEGAGFINFYLVNDYFYLWLKDLLINEKEALKINLGKKRSVLIEFVSANPTGPLSVAHARQAAVGDVLANILDFLNFKIKREYYLNDEGNQIDILGKSVELRIRELNGENLEFPLDYYQGDYIYDIARKIKNQKTPHLLRQAGKVKSFSRYSVKCILSIIKKELDDFGVKFDSWYSQRNLRKSSKIKKILVYLKKKGFLYEKDGALWFKSTQFGDDKDRVVVKSDGSYTYLAPDIAYHADKYRRGFVWLINLWGPDHHGYINRLKAAVKALGKNPDSLSIIIVQLATLFRKGKPIQMSTRKGQYISLHEVIGEVGSDAARFFFLMRRTSSHLDFDLEIAKKQTPENPVYYIQYAHARICSIMRHAKAEAKSILKSVNLRLLKEKEEIGIIKNLWRFSYVLNVCLNTRDPYMLTVYLQDLAESFHKFYDQHRVLSQDDLLTQARLLLIEATRIVIATGLELLGVSRPKKM